ncbi:acyl-CoA dehydrogenase [uncultured Aquabacterium sp.]|jgi:butyryl-CoA dehydrogenase|uniref:acyl-CoA dehydrogenase n=1 Tax=uncultured Aquabacterium sp. TaxID=158753 RepID=UPI0026321AF1|nr:acyl-CoA dehydrogenase [uncultured Aquabacterium sp.]
MTHRATVDFLLYDWLKADGLCARERHAEHNRETFTAVLDLSEQIATEQFAPINRLIDVHEPEFDGTTVTLPKETPVALQAFADAGLMAASKDAEVGGMQLPTVVEIASMSFFYKCSVGLAAYPMLTRGNANTILAHGTPKQIEVFAKGGLEGRTFGTMCLSEPQAGSSLSDIVTRAVPDVQGDGSGVAWQQDELGPRYRLTGNKMWISGGEHEMGENIVHLVLAKIPGPDGKLIPGVKGISLFIVPRKLVKADGTITGQRNDVALAGLNHKCGYRGTVNTLLNFGEGKFPVNGHAGAVGYLIGKEGEGLKCMFTLMNEARISVGLGATMLGYAGYEASLEYAKQRPQGRAMGAGGKDHSAPQIPIIEHTDVKRMLMMQKAVAEGGLALGLLCAQLVDDEYTGSPDERDNARLLLELLTPIAKSWPSEWAQEANSQAIQILGGYGYTRDFPVEQYWRDNRLNMIHEGTHGIQGLDLLGRKVVMNGGKALAVLAARISDTVTRAGQVDGLAEHANALAGALQKVGAATKAAWATGVPEEALANATPYLQAFGHTVMAWIWLELALAAKTAQAAGEWDKGPLGTGFLKGKLATADYFYAYELPKIDAWLGVVARRDLTCARAEADWF